jgi:hypothetical protein
MPRIFVHATVVSQFEVTEEALVEAHKTDGGNLTLKLIDQIKNDTLNSGLITVNEWKKVNGEEEDAKKFMPIYLH